jgi:polyphosphate kinase
MPRNLDHRIEIVVPVESPRAQAELNTILDTLWQDNRQAWQLDSTGRWTRLQPADGEKPKVAQTVLMRRAQLRERRQIEYRNRGR